MFTFAPHSIKSALSLLIHANEDLINMKELLLDSNVHQNTTITQSGTFNRANQHIHLDWTLTRFKRFDVLHHHSSKLLAPPQVASKAQNEPLCTSKAWNQPLRTPMLQMSPCAPPKLQISPWTTPKLQFSPRAHQCFKSALMHLQSSNDLLQTT